MDFTKSELMILVKGLHFYVHAVKLEELTVEEITRLTELYERVYKAWKEKDKFGDIGGGDTK